MRQDPAAGELAGRITLADFPGCRPALLNGRHLRRVIAFTRSPLRPAPHTLRHSRYRGELSPGRTKPCAMEEEPGAGESARPGLFLEFDDVRAARTSSHSIQISPFRQCSSMARQT